MTAGLNELLSQLRTEYIATIPEKIKTLQNLLSGKQYEPLRNEFHKLKGTGKTYGVPEITKLCEVVERLCTVQTTELHWVIPAAVGILHKIHQTRQRQSEYAVDQDLDFIKIRQHFKLI